MVKWNFAGSWGFVKSCVIFDDVFLAEINKKLKRVVIGK